MKYQYSKYSPKNIGEKEQDTASLLQNGQNFRIVRLSQCGDGRDGEISRFLTVFLIQFWISC